MSSERAFEFSRAMARLCQDVALRVDEFRHVRMEQVLVTFAQARRRVAHGLQAKLTPMRFEDGRLTTRRGGRLWTLERMYSGDREILYILTFYLPRFLDQSFREKMVTVFHELFHVNPQFNGDIRRFRGRCHVHSHSQKGFDRAMSTLVDRYLAARPPAECYAFLTYKFAALKAAHGGIVGLRVPIPRLVPLPESKAG
jgi:hypothetical protein